MTLASTTTRTTKTKARATRAMSTWHSHWRSTPFWSRVGDSRAPRRRSGRGTPTDGESWRQRGGGVDAASPTPADGEPPRRRGKRKNTFASAPHAAPGNGNDEARVRSQVLRPGPSRVASSAVASGWTVHPALLAQESDWDWDFVAPRVPKSDRLRDLLHRSIRRNMLFWACAEEELRGTSSPPLTLPFAARGGQG